MIHFYTTTLLPHFQKKIYFLQFYNNPKIHKKVAQYVCTKKIDIEERKKMLGVTIEQREVA